MDEHGQGVVSMIYPIVTCFNPSMPDFGYGWEPLPPMRDVESADGDIVVPIDLRAWGLG